MSQPDWISEGPKIRPKQSSGNMDVLSGIPPATDESADRTAMISARLKSIYRRAVLPVEKRYRYDYFFESPLLTDVEFDAKPQVLLVGQYSVGKTSFIRYLLSRDFPGQRIGPEPTTDRFTGESSRTREIHIALFSCSFPLLQSLLMAQMNAQFLEMPCLFTQIYHSEDWRDLGFPF
mmetsp:Transcript_20976/g.30224  ORF Transcript_20976/g.30224 Transcript_20976/m.30224 type:complete len:177 (+) Transcript_20976:87-617(+)